MRSRLRNLAPALALCVAPTPTLAIDGNALVLPPGEEESYYEHVLQGAPVSALAETAGGIPDSLEVVEAAGAASYAPGQGDAWRLEVVVDERPHERVDAVYDLVVAIPLPVRADGTDAFASAPFAIQAREGSAEHSVAFVYGGEKVVLKRNRALERGWLPVLTAGSLPDLAGSGYRYTLWDAILRYDPGRGAIIQGRGELAYVADAGTPAPDPGDPRFGVYVISWIPVLDSAVPPYTIRLDVVPPES